MAATLLVECPLEQTLAIRDSQLKMAILVCKLAHRVQTFQQSRAMYWGL